MTASRGRTAPPATRSQSTRSRARSGQAFAAAGSCNASGIIPVRPLAQPKQRTRQGNDQGEENDHNRGGVSDIVIDEGDAVEIEVDGFRSRAGAALGNGEDDVKALHRVDHADHGRDEKERHDKGEREIAEYLPASGAVDLCA